MRLFGLLGMVLSLTSGAFAANITLEPGTTTTLQAGNTYKLSHEDATYIVTTKGKSVGAKLSVRASCTLILTDCHLFSDSTLGIPALTFENVPNKRLDVRFKGKNSLTSVSSYALAAIQIPAGRNPTLSFAALEADDTASELFLRGSSEKTNTFPPIHLNGTGKVLFSGGNIRLAATEDRDATPETSPYFIPALVSAQTVELCGAIVTVQLCPLLTSGGLEGKQLITPGSANALFDCETFRFTGGTLTTAGDKPAPENSTSAFLHAQSKAYDTTYAYPEALMKQMTTATQQTLIGGICRTGTKAYCYGFLPKSTIPSACFTHTGTATLPEQTADASGMVTVANADAYPDLALNYSNETASDAATVFETPLIPTDKGLTTNAVFGISHLTMTAVGASPVLTLALELPNETNALDKEYRIQILRETDDSPPVVIDEAAITFRRANVQTSRFTATYTCAEKLSSLEGCSHRYTIRALN